MAPISTIALYMGLQSLSWLSPISASMLPGDFSRDSNLARRDTSPTTVCLREAGQSALVNGTIYYFGGRTKSSSSVKVPAWNNDFVKLDVSSSWSTGSAPIVGLPKPDGPPAIASGALWHSLTSLFVYGGEYTDQGDVTPDPFSLWEYDLLTSKWTEHDNPQMDSGANSAKSGADVQRVAEGAGVSVPHLGRGYYFGGHLDHFTTPGWSVQVARQYLTSLVEYTFPGFKNTQDESIKSGKTAGKDGVFRNITTGGIQDQGNFPPNADGAIVYVPGYGKDGVLISLGGGTNETYNQFNPVYVYDIATSVWYEQATSGNTQPQPRVNPCAVALSSMDGSSTNLYMYGGQDLLPADKQEQFGDLWILSMPSFTWIEATPPQNGSPAARAGHVCEVWDAQMIVIGGYNDQFTCDSPGVFVLDASELKWKSSFEARSANGAHDSPNNQSIQVSQKGDPAALAGSYGYRVPSIVQKAIGGGPTGGATATKPVASATSGPFASGHAATYSVPPSAATATSAESGSGGGSGGSGSSVNVAAIVAGVIAGICFVVACYLGFCVWVYRRQLKLYQHHRELSAENHLQRQAGEKPGVGGIFGKRFSASFMPGAAGIRRSAGTSDRGSSSPYVASNGFGEGTPHNNSGAFNGHPGLGGTTTIEGGVHGYGGDLGRRGSADTDDLMRYQEPSFIGVLLRPRRSLRVVNR